MKWGCHGFGKLSPNGLQGARASIIRQAQDRHAEDNQALSEQLDKKQNYKNNSYQRLLHKR